jgi:GxxExxY protein
MKENEIGKEVVDAAVKIHSALGPGLLESVYEVVLARELERRGLAVARQVAVPIELLPKHRLPRSLSMGCTVHQR